MAVKPYFQNFSYVREQQLIEDLVIESIKTYGVECKYLPRTIVKEDDLFGEDTLSTFGSAASVELYLVNVEGFGGEGDFLSKFNLEIRDQVTFALSRKRFDQIKTEKLGTEFGWNFKQEDGDLFLLEAGTADGYSITSSRPLEGDLLYLPLTGKIYEIKFVEHEKTFYQTGTLQFFELRCELFEYSSERFDTGDVDIDAIETAFSADILNTELSLEDGLGELLDEDGGSIIQESFRIEDTDRGANNEHIQTEGEAIIDYSEQSPFSEIDRY